MKKIFLALLIGPTVVLSCSKTSSNSPEVIKKIATAFWTGAWSKTENYTYDNTGKLIKMEGTNEIRTYDFNGNTVIIKEFDKDQNKIVSTLTGTLDNSGKITSATANYAYTGNNPINAQLSFIYDTNGFLTKLTDTRTNGTMYVYDITINNNNITQVKRTLNGQLDFTFTYDYYTDKINKRGIEYSDVMGIYHNSILGKMSKNLLKTYKGISPNTINPNWLDNISYTLDSEGFPTKMTFTTVSGSSMQCTYTYK